MENISEVNDKLMRIKRSFRLVMNGVAAQSMRDKGLVYHMNWGVALPSLKAMAGEYGKDRGLAVALWNENIRECKILATLIMPPDSFSEADADVWMEQMPTVEIAEQASFNLYQHLPFAEGKACQWIASGSELYNLCGYHTLSRLFMRGLKPGAKCAGEFLGRAAEALRGDSVAVGKAALSCLLRFAELGEGYESSGNMALKAAGVSF